MRTTRAIVITWLVGLCLVPVVLGQTATRPDFTGTWVIEPGKSDFGEAPVPKVHTLTIAHKEPQITVNRETEDRKDSTAFRTDGVETKSDSECCGTIRTTGRWDGTTLRRRVVSETFTQLDSWTLAADGKTLTIVREVNQDGGDGAFKLRMVFSKKN
jgi:hypothetical protein